ncbi:MAG: hypothetical protein ACI9QC_000242 [Oceanicoccus sp.]|jgi:hypothetical protein
MTDKESLWERIDAHLIKMSTFEQIERSRVTNDSEEDYVYLSLIEPDPVKESENVLEGEESLLMDRLALMENKEFKKKKTIGISADIVLLDDTKYKHKPKKITARKKPVIKKINVKKKVQKKIVKVSIKPVVKKKVVKKKVQKKIVKVSIKPVVKKKVLKVVSKSKKKRRLVKVVDMHAITREDLLNKLREDTLVEWLSIGEKYSEFEHVFRDAVSSLLKDYGFEYFDPLVNKHDDELSKKKAKHVFDDLIDEMA